jgi:hypothetical protein
LNCVPSAPYVGLSCVALRILPCAALSSVHPHITLIAVSLLLRNCTRRNTRSAAPTSSTTATLAPQVSRSEVGSQQTSSTPHLNRYPAGESYMDVIERVKPVIIELERQRRSIVIVCHLAVLRYAAQRSAEGCSDCAQTAFLSV